MHTSSARPVIGQEQDARPGTESASWTAKPRRLVWCGNHSVRFLQSGRQIDAL